MTKILLILTSILLLATVSSADSQDTTFSNDKALQGLKETKAFFDVTVGNPKLLLVRLKLVEKTHSQLVTAGVSPAFIIGVRGKASRFFTKGTGYVLESDLPEKAQIAAQVKKLKALNIGIEQCSIAAGFEDIDLSDFLPEVELVANGYVSMIGYHSKGYGLVPMD